MFKYNEGKYFENVKSGKVLEVTGGADKEGQSIIVGIKGTPAKGSAAAKGKADVKNIKHQHWNVVYLDEAKKEPTKGLYKPFGFHINRPFVILSLMPMRRVVEVVGAKNLVIRQKVFGKREQQFYFDITTKTIKSVAYNYRSFNIEKQGRSSNIGVWNTNARWF